MIAVRIAGTGSAAPGHPVTTAELVERVSPKRDAADTEARTGIAVRHFADAGTTHATVAVHALREALSAAAMPATALRRLILVSSLGGDMLIPATANFVAAGLGLAGTCDCFDLNNACMGFLSAFDIGARSVATGIGPVGIVAVELGSRYIMPEDPRPFLVFADAAAAAVLDTGRDGEGIIGSWLRNDGTAGGDVTLAHPGLTHTRETIRFATPNRRMAELAIAAVRRSTDAVLGQAGVRLADVQWILPHQPNGALLAAIVNELGIDPNRVVRVVHEVGSVGSVSIPTSLDRLMRSRRVCAGDRILMVGVGAGLSTGAILFQVAAP